MSEILKLILSQESIYDKGKFYKNIVRNNFLFTEQIPILYKVNNKEEFLKFLNENKIENDSLSSDFGVIYLYIDELDLLLNLFDEFNGSVYMDFSYPLKFSDVNSNFNSCVYEINVSNKLTGQGVVIGFLDTGIDYTLKAFRNEDGTTRLRYMYDSNNDVIYTKNEINEALKLDNPFDLIKENDFKGHGTAVISIASAGGDINKDLYGVAPKSEIISINITNDIDSTESLFHTVMKGLDFLLKKQKEEGFPLVVNLSFSTNYGSHTGRSIFEEFVSDFAKNKNITVVVSAGNEGGVAHHKSGRVTNEWESVNVEIDGDYKVIPISLYRGILSDISIKISSPSFLATSEIKSIKSSQVLNVDSDNVAILVSGPTVYNTQSEIQIILIADKNDYIEKGIWNIEIKLDNDYESIYDMWLPTTEIIGNKTRFLNPDNNNTLGSPATVYNVISVGSYNYRTESISVFSGKGALNNIYNIKPDLLAPGEEVKVIYPGGRTSNVSGTSFSAPVVSGICALLMEWGIVRKNKENLYGEIMKYFLIRGCKRLKDIEYPDNSYGYGFVCASKSFIDINASVDNLLDSLPKKLFKENQGDFREAISYLDENKIKLKMCSLDVFNDPNRVEFLGVINKNVENISDYVCMYPLEKQTEDEFLSIISIPIENLDDFDKLYFSNGNISIEKSYYYSLCSESISPITDANIYKVQNNQYLDLSGRDVIVGIIDTGIDYLNKEFTNEFGETRILEIWDQTISSEYNSDILFGSVYTKDQIDAAIKLGKSGGDPYSLVPSKDDIGHGTAMAGITSAYGYGSVKGGAPNSDIVVVKLKEVSKEFKEYLNYDIDGDPIFDEVSIHLAIRYLKRIKFKYNKPMVVLIPLQTNGGDHCGNTILGDQINQYSENSGFIVVVPSGNQANKQIHASGTIEKNSEGIIELFVDKGQNKLRVNIYAENFANVSVVVISPSGERTDKFKLKFGKTYEFKFLFEETKMKILSLVQGNCIEMFQYIEILFNELKPGIWQIILESEEGQKFKYDAYLSIKELLKSETKFLNSDSENTVTSPGVSRLAVSMGYYNQENMSIIPESGQGTTLDGRICPILVAGGVNMLTTGKSGREYLISGSSVSAAVATGGIALILEWAIIRENIPQMNASLMIWILISSATLQKGYKFPNKYWGYGILNIKNVFEIFR